MNEHGLIAGLLLAGVLLSAGASAADISAADNIIVTATRTEISVDDAIVPVRVITRDDIELSLATDLAELLRFEAGIDIGRNGGPGQATSVFMQGTESNHTLVLVDGVRINPGTIGGAAVQHIAPEMIERVEIVKGARSSLFGTDAIGGVINIITRDADEAYVDAGAGGGSFSTRTAHLSAGAGTDNGKIGATVGWTGTDGFAPRIESDTRRGYDNLSLNIFGSRKLGSSDVSVRHWRADGNVEYLDFFLSPVDQDYKNSATALQVDTPFAGRGNSKLIVSHSVDEIRQRQAPDFVESTRLTLDWQYSHAFANHTLTGGIYAVDENAESLSFGSGFDEDTDVRAVFLQDQVLFGRHRAFAAVRLSDHESFGNETTWNAEYAFDLSDDWTVSAGLGRAFRAPDATDRFGFGGNPDLQPEIVAIQLGLRYSAGNRHRFDLELYRNDLDDLIEFDLATFMLVNVDEAEIRGAQVGYEYRGDAFTVRTELVNQRADNKATGERLLRRAENSATLTYTQNIGAHRIGISVLASGDREDFGGAELDSYVLVNLTGQLQLGRTLSLNARIENLFDEDYETAASFRMQELSGFVELRYRWR
ncbi:MAG: TonB-dependent receptor [Woeseiaceae bacterium]|nr:TonB-dependent receptor [Woeseiaceae bacterium]